ncbi:MAG TPA: glycosyltransferase family 39 protein [Pyrinomonadaceae bacterium]|jgi:4-amino-4-deoxy-L-arabinose transferase-like glycosyltransferase
MTPTKPPGQGRFFSGSSSFSPLYVLIPVTTFALFWKLGASSLAAWDEAIYAQVSKEILRGGDWLTLHWQYEPWFEKPPLFVWVTAILYRFLGVNEYGARAASALSGVALVVLTYLIAKRAYDQRVGWLAAVILLTSYYFLSFSRFGTMEVMLSLFIYLTLYGYLRLKEGDEKWWYLIWTSCALALMAKGAGGLIAPAVLWLALFFDKRFARTIQSRHFWQAFLLAALLVAPWHILMYIRYERAFIGEYIGYHVIARTTQTLEGHPTTHLYYLAKLIDGFFPWCLLAPFAVASGVREILKGKSRSLIFLLVSALVFGLYTLIPTRRPWYIVPLFPALAVLIAAFLTNLFQAYRERPAHRRIIASLCVLLVTVGGLYSLLSLYLNSRGEEPIARLARLAQSTSAEDRQSLVLFSESEPFYAQTPLFYSNRPIQQTYDTVKPASEDASRYVNFTNLADVAQNSQKPIIFRQGDAARLATLYDISTVAEADALVYATIKRK